MSLARGFLSGLSLSQALQCIINIYVILRKRNLFEMGAVRSARESRSVALVWRLGILVTGAWFCAHAGGNNNSVKRIAAVLGGVCFFLYFCVHPV